MKKKLKMMAVLLAIVVLVVLVAIVIMAIPGGVQKVADMTGKPVAAVKNTLVTIIGTGVGLTLISFGVSSLAVPIVGIPLIAVGLFLVGYSLYTSGWFGNQATTTIPINSAGLNKAA